LYDITLKFECQGFSNNAKQDFTEQELTSSNKEHGKAVWNIHMDTLLNNLQDKIEKHSFDAIVLNGILIYEEDFYNPKQEIQIIASTLILRMTWRRMIGFNCLYMV